MDDRDFERVEPYIEMMLDKLRKSFEGIQNDKDIIGLKNFIKKKGVNLHLIVCLGVEIVEEKSQDEPDKESIKSGDADFLKDLKIKRY